MCGADVVTMLCVLNSSNGGSSFVYIPTVLYVLPGGSRVVEFNGKFEIVSLSGTLSSSGHHVHMSIADCDGNVFGGHLMEGCLVRTTAEIVLVCSLYVP
jgi:hypothetical protein